jgi:peptide/nickel transport system substrate-binding protein
LKCEVGIADKANALLDGIGLTEHDGNGVRLLTSGKPVSFIVDVFISAQPELIDMLHLLELNWAANQY